jgi:DNA topoisomerase VI subunit A
MEFSYTDSARQKLKEMRLPPETAEAMILGCEREQRVVLSERTARRFCHQTVGCVTLWAEYEKNGAEILVRDLYYHRVVIAGETPEEEKRS